MINDRILEQVLGTGVFILIIWEMILAMVGIMIYCIVYGIVYCTERKKFGESWHMS